MAREGRANNYVLCLQLPSLQTPSTSVSPSERPRPLCLCLYVSLSVSLAVCMSPCLCLFSVSVFLPASLCLSLCLPLSLSLSLSLLRLATEKWLLIDYCSHSANSFMPSLKLVLRLSLIDKGHNSSHSYRTIVKRLFEKNYSKSLNVVTHDSHERETVFICALFIHTRSAY